MGVEGAVGVFFWEAIFIFAIPFDVASHLLHLWRSGWTFETNEITVVLSKRVLQQLRVC